MAPIPLPSSLRGLRRHLRAQKARLYRVSFPFFWVHSGKFGSDILVDLGRLVAQATQAPEGNSPGGKVLNSMLRAIEFFGKRFVNDCSDRLALFGGGDL